MRARSLVRLGLVWLAVGGLGVGCIPIPAALPPAKASIGFGAAIGNPIPDETGARLSEAEGYVRGRVGLTVQSLFPELHRRPVEVAAGYSFRVFTNELRQNRNRHGFYGSISGLLGDFWLGDNWRGRVVVRGGAEYLALQSHPGDGGGGSWGVGFEVARFTRTEGDDNDSFFLGWAAGELSLGAELFGGYYSVGGGEWGEVGLALTGRWPGLFGVAMIPLNGSF